MPEKAKKKKKEKRTEKEKEKKKKTKKKPKAPSPNKEANEESIEVPLVPPPKLGSHRSTSPGISGRKTAKTPPLRTNTRGPSEGILLAESYVATPVKQQQQKPKKKKKASLVVKNSDLYQSNNSYQRYYIGSGLPSGLRSGLPSGF